MRLLLVLLTAVTGLAQTGPATAAEGGFVSAFSLGPGDSTVAAAVAESDGGLTIAADFGGTIDADPGTGMTNYTSAGARDLLVATYSVSGALVRSGVIAAQGGSSVNVNALVRDGAGNYYVAGRFFGTVDVAPGPPTSLLVSGSALFDGFLVKLSPTFDLLWSVHLSSTDPVAVIALAVDPAGSVYAAGQYGGTVDFDPSGAAANRAAGTIADIFLVKLDTNRLFQWVRVAGGGRPNGLVVAGSSVYVAGYFIGTSDFDDADPQDPDDTSISGPSQDSFVWKLGTDGSFAWRSAVFGDEFSEALGVTAAGSSAIYVTGVFSKDATFDTGSGPHTVTSPSGSGDEQAYLWKLEPNGDLIWVRQFGGANDDDGRSVAVDEAGRVHLTGRFRVAGDFDPGPGTSTLTALGGIDVFIVSLDAAGTLIDARAIGGPSDDFARGIAAGGAGSIYQVGSFGTSMDADPGPGTQTLSNATNGGYVVKLLAISANQPPINTVPGPLTVAEDNALVLAGANRLAVTDVDAGTSPISVTLTAANGTVTLSQTTGLTVAGGANGSPTVTVTGTIANLNAALDGLLFRPNPNVSGTASIAILTNDLGSSGTGGPLTDSDTVPIAVTPVNDAPAAQADSFTVTTGTTLEVPAPGVLANDTDPDAGTTLQAQVVRGPGHGSLSLAEDGSFRYTPTAGFAGPDSFAYRASDGTTTSPATTVTLQVAATACVPRPAVRAQPAADGSRLTVVVEATPLNTPANNPLRAIRFGQLQNARVTLNGQNVEPGATHVPPPSTVSVTFTVQRVTAGQPTTVFVEVEDGCGTWPTFVGGGTNAGF